jgi:hypothetical protein
MQPVVYPLMLKPVTVPASTSLGSKPHHGPHGSTYWYISLRTAIEYYVRTFYRYNLVQSNISSLCSIIQCYDTIAHYRSYRGCYGLLWPKIKVC